MATARVYADTNVFYYVGNGSLRVEDVIGSGEELWATPINLLEIVGSVRFGNFAARQLAAKAILSAATGIATDTESHMQDLLGGVAPNQANVDAWGEVAKCLRDAPNEAALESGVADWAKRVSRTVNVSLLELTKKTHYDQFAEGVARACDNYLPGYLDAFQQKLQPPKLKKTDRIAFRGAMQSNAFLSAMMVFGIAGRYSLLSGGPLNLSDPKVGARAVDSFAPYCAVYGAYLSELMTAGRKPEPNDWGDLELFLYMQPNNFVATAEKKWWTISDSAGVGHRVRRVISS